MRPGDIRIEAVTDGESTMPSWFSGYADEGEGALVRGGRHQTQIVVIRGPHGAP